MKFTALKTDVKDGNTRIYLLEGDEVYFIDRGVETILSAFVSEPTLDYAVFEGSSIKGNAVNDFISSVYAYPFLSQKRVVRINNFYPAEKEFERIKQVFEQPSESTVLVIVNSQRGKGIDLKKQKNVVTVDCGKADEEDVVKWIFITLKKSGVYADTSVCRTFAEYCSFSMSRIAMETQKLLAFAGEGGSLTQEDIEALISRDSDYKIYELTSAVARKNYTQYISIMEDMLLKGYDETTFLSALANYYKTLYDCFMSPLSDGEAAKLFGIKEYAVKKNREQASRIGKEKLKENFSIFYRAANDIKNGTIAPKSALAVVNSKIFFS